MVAAGFRAAAFGAAVLFVVVLVAAAFAGALIALGSAGAFLVVTALVLSALAATDALGMLDFIGASFGVDTLVAGALDVIIAAFGVAATTLDLAAAILVATTFGVASTVLDLVVTAVGILGTAWVMIGWGVASLFTRILGSEANFGLATGTGCEEILTVLVRGAGFAIGFTVFGIFDEAGF